MARHVRRLRASLAATALLAVIAAGVTVTALLASRSDAKPMHATVRPSRTPSGNGGLEHAPTPSTPTVAPSTNPPAGKLTGKVIAIDPGHNGGNFTNPDTINQIIWNGRENETCDTTGTETDSGYTESQFNFNVATMLEADLQAVGATVVLTRNSDSGVGPCVTQRAAIGNQANANAAISIHADGGPPDGRGFAILEPVADGVNEAIVGPSQQLGSDLRMAFLGGTGMPVSTYDGVDGIQPRDDLAGINLSTVPKVFIECGNMRNSTDATLLTSANWQKVAARALAAGIETFLESP